jgi:DNA processing protein
LAVAIVGSRRGTPYGLRVAERLGADLGVRGVTVVSGLARGVDTAAHRGALGAGGRTLAVLGSGVDVVYPPENRRLAAEVVEAGALVSQFPMGTAPLPHHFPARNRVIAGLSLGTVVVEAAERSGALITARLAGELGREVYAVPGNVSSPGSLGANRLIQDGAKLVQSWEDVVAEWPPEWRRALRVVPSPGTPPRPEAGEAIEPGERAVFALLGDEPVAVDALVERSQLPSSQVSAALMGLELRGLVRRLAGQRYVRG